MQPDSAFFGTASKLTFTLPAPAIVDPHKNEILCATQNFVPSMNAVTSGEPLPDEDGTPLDPEFSPRDWCNAERFERFSH